jgi:hypothetical protein
MDLAILEMIINSMPILMRAELQSKIAAEAFEMLKERYC